jgi:hypothetical protein
MDTNVGGVVIRLGTVSDRETESRFQRLLGFFYSIPGRCPGLKLRWRLWRAQLLLRTDPEGIDAGRRF